MKKLGNMKKYFIVETEGDEQVPHINVGEEGGVSLIKFGEEQGSIVDYGDGYIVKVGEEEFDLEYDDFCNLYDMMTVVIREDEDLRFPYKLLKDE